jgi:hypothetical protein
MVVDPSRILVLTLCIGEDYRRKLGNCLKSKEEYCKRHGYTYILGGEEYWDRDRPFSWSKVPFMIAQIKKAMETGAYDYIWMSDADVWITNMDLRIEDQILPLFSAGKDLLMTFDTCHHINAGNIVWRPCAWALDFLERSYKRPDAIYHIWWENKAFCDLFEENEDDREHLEVTAKSYMFNAYLMGMPGERLWLPGDFLIHFAGVYDSKKMAGLIEEIRGGAVPRIDMWNGDRLPDGRAEKSQQ